jgi:hypothetical protein
VPARRDRRRIQVLADDRHRLVAHEGRATTDHLVEHRAETIQVGARRDLPAHRLLRRHVRHCPDHHAGLGQSRAVHRHREAEVADHRPAILRQPDIPRFQVAMDDALRVDELQTLTRIDSQLHGLLDRQSMPLGLLNQPFDVASRQQWQNQVGLGGGRGRPKGLPYGL